MRIKEVPALLTLFLDALRIEPEQLIKTLVLLTRCIFYNVNLHTTCMACIGNLRDVQVDAYFLCEMNRKELPLNCKWNNDMKK